MIFAQGEMRDAREALGLLGELSPGSHKKILVRCDSGVSEKCRGEYEAEYRHALQYMANN